MAKTTKAGNWYHLIDAIRGLALLNMVLFHFFYDVYVIFGKDTGWYRHPAVRAWQQYICISFLLVSGISWHFSRNNLKRGILLNFYGLLITAVTLLFMPSQTVWFGILNCIGCATLLMLPIHKLFHKLSGRLPSHKAILSAGALLFSLLLFSLTVNIQDGCLLIFGYDLTLPDWLYTFRPMTILGFPSPSFSSSDYFPILPWFFLFEAGYFSWELICCRTCIRDIFLTKVPILSRIGKNTIWIYLLHQPLLYTAAYFLTQILKPEFIFS